MEHDGQHALGNHLHNAFVAHQIATPLREPPHATPGEKLFVQRVNSFLPQHIQEKTRFSFDAMQPLSSALPLREMPLYGLPTLRSLASLEERIGREFAFGQAADTGDCLYDSFAQVLDRTIPEGHPQRTSLLEALGGSCTHASVRRAIHAYMQAHQEKRALSGRARDPEYAAHGHQSMNDLEAQYPQKVESYNRELQALKERGQQAQTKQEWDRFKRDYQALQKQKPTLGAPVWGDFITESQALHFLLKEKNIDIAFTVHNEGREVLSEAQEEDEEEEASAPSLLDQIPTKQEEFHPPKIQNQKSIDLALHEIRTLEDGTTLERISTPQSEETWLIRSPGGNFDLREPGEDPLEPLPEGRSEVHIAAYGGVHFFPLFRKPQ